MMPQTIVIGKLHKIQARIVATKLQRPKSTCRTNGKDGKDNKDGC